MERIGRPRFTREQKAELWERWKSGESPSDIARALERRTKGGVYRILASTGGIMPAATQHVAGEMLKQAAKIDLIYVPFAGGAPSVAATVGGHVNIVIANISEVMPQIEAGKPRLLAVTTRERDPTLKTVPTVAESGIKDYEVINPVGSSAEQFGAQIRSEMARYAKVVKEAGIRAD